MTTREITSVEHYKLYLKTQIEAYTKDERKAIFMVALLNEAFLDGVKFGQGDLKVEVLDDWDIKELNKGKTNEQS